MLAQGANAAGGTPEDFARHIAAETAKWAKVVKASGREGGLIARSGAARPPGPRGASAPRRAPHRIAFARRHDRVPAAAARLRPRLALGEQRPAAQRRDGHVLIDTGYVSHAPLTLALLASPRGVGDERGRAGRQHALPQRPHGRQRGRAAPLRLHDRACPSARRPTSRRGTGARCGSTMPTRPPSASPPTTPSARASATSGATSPGTRSPPRGTTWARCASTTRSTAS